MPANALPLALLVICGLSLSGFDLVRKLLSKHLAPVPMVFLLAIASVPIFGVAVLISSKPTLAANYGWPAVSSITLNLGAHLAFLHAVRVSHLSVTVPLLSLTPVFTALTGLAVLGERPSLAVFSGILLVVAGALWLASIPAPDAPRQPRLSWRLLRLPGSMSMVVAAFLWSLTLPLDKLAIERSSVAVHGFVLTAGIAVGAFFVLLATRRIGELSGLRHGGGLFLVALLASSVALGSQLMVLQMVLVSVVETMKRGIGNLMALVLGRLIFGEAFSFHKLGSALTMAIGVALILI